MIESIHAAADDCQLPPFDSVRAAFMEGQPLYPNAGFHEKNHIQICVRNPECIRAYFRPRESNKHVPKNRKKKKG